MQGQKYITYLIYLNTRVHLTIIICVLTTYLIIHTHFLF